MPFTSASQEELDAWERSFQPQSFTYFGSNFDAAAEEERRRNIEQGGLFLGAPAEATARTIATGIVWPMQGLFDLYRTLELGGIASEAGREEAARQASQFQFQPVSTPVTTPGIPAWAIPTTRQQNPLIPFIPEPFQGPPPTEEGLVNQQITAALQTGIPGTQQQIEALKPPSPFEYPPMPQLDFRTAPEAGRSLWEIANTPITAWGTGPFPRFSEPRDFAQGLYNALMPFAEFAGSPVGQALPLISRIPGGQRAMKAFFLGEGTRLGATGAGKFMGTPDKLGPEAGEAVGEAIGGGLMVGGIALEGALGMLKRSKVRNLRRAVESYAATTQRRWKRLQDINRRLEQIAEEKSFIEGEAGPAFRFNSRGDLEPLRDLSPDEIRLTAETLRLVRERKRYASDFGQTAAFHGDVRSQEAQAKALSTAQGSEGIQPSAQDLAPETQVLLNQALEKNRQAGRLAEVEFLDTFGEDAMGNLVDADRPMFGIPATRDMQGNVIPGKIMISIEGIRRAQEALPPDVFEKWFTTSIGEEGIHANVLPAQSMSLWESLTKAQQRAIYRLYTRGHGGPIRNIDLAHEALRMFIQKLSGEQITEIAELGAVGKPEQWTVKTIDALLNIIHGTRRLLNTRGYQQQRVAEVAVVEQMRKNLDRLREAAAKQAEAPPPSEPTTPQEEMPFTRRRSSAYEEWATQYKRKQDEMLSAFKLYTALAAEAPGNFENLIWSELALKQSTDKIANFLEALPVSRKLKDAVIRWNELRLEMEQLETSPHYENMMSIEGEREDFMNLESGLGPNTRRYQAWHEKFIKNRDAVDAANDEVLAQARIALPDLPFARDIVAATLREVAFKPPFERSRLLERMEVPENVRTAILNYLEALDKLDDMTAEPEFQMMNLLAKQPREQESPQLMTIGLGPGAKFPFGFNKNQRAVYKEQIEKVWRGDQVSAFNKLKEMVDARVFPAATKEIATALLKLGDKGVVAKFYPDLDRYLEAHGVEYPFYSTRRDAIFLPPLMVVTTKQYGLSAADVYLHEYVHGLTSMNIDSQPFAGQVSNLREKLRNWKNSNVLSDSQARQDVAYALQNNDEFLSMALSSPHVQNILKQIEATDVYKGRSLIMTAFDKLIREIGRLLGFGDDAALADALKLVMEMGRRRPVTTWQQMGLFHEDYPFARRRRQPHEEFNFVPAEPGEQPAPIWETLTPKAVQEAGREVVESKLQAGEVPSLEEFAREIGGRFGPVPKKALYHHYFDTLIPALTTAKGSIIDAILTNMKLKGPLFREHQKGMGRIPDAVEPRQIQAQFEELTKLFPYKKPRVKGWMKANWSPEQQRRYAAIGAILNELTKEAGTPPKELWDRKEIGPEDVRQTFQVTRPGAVSTVTEPGAPPREEIQPAEYTTRAAWRNIEPSQWSAEDIGKEMVRGAGVDATGEGAPPRSVSHNVVALRDTIGGKIVMVSAWKDPKRGVRIVDPTAPSLPSRKWDEATFKRYRPFAIIGLRVPIRGYWREFPTQAAFDEFWGDVGIEGTEGLRTSSFTGPNRLIGEVNIGTAQGGTPKPVTDLPMPPESLVSETARELTAPGPRRPIPEAPILYRMPRPPSETMLPPEAAKEVEAQARMEYPDVQQVPPEGFVYPKPTGKIVEYGKPEKLQPGYTLRQTAQKGKYYAPSRGGESQYQPSEARYPATLRRDALSITEAVKRQFLNYAKRRDVKLRIPEMMDGLMNAADLEAQAFFSEVLLASGEKEPFKRPFRDLLDPVNYFKDFHRWWTTRAELQKQATMMRKAALAVIATGTLDKTKTKWKSNRGFVREMYQWLEIAQGKADILMRSGGVKSLIGFRYNDAIKEAREILDFAVDHWKDPVLRQTVATVRNALKTEINFENKNGWTVSERENYTPSRYEAAFWGDEGWVFNNSTIGTIFRKRKAFNNYWQALSYGPYIPATWDAAELVAHRVRTGRQQIARSSWIQDLRGLYDPVSGEPVAKSAIVTEDIVPGKDPVTGAPIWVQKNKYSSPGIDYRDFIQLSPSAPPVYVRASYKLLLDALVTPSKIHHLPMAREAQMVAAAMKHGVLLLWDTFHLGRLYQYGAALMGKDLGWAGGKAAVQYSKEQLQPAVDKGFITQKQADWALKKVRVVSGTVRGRPTYTEMTHQDIAHEMISQGLNATKMSDALYKDVVSRIPIIGKYHHAIIGPYNRWLFDKFVPGLMVETAVRNFVKYNNENPKVPFNRLMRDVIRDTNIFYGNLGRQGWFKSQTWRDFAQILLLAPMWVEGLIQKEIRMYGRIFGLSKLTGGRKGLPYLGLLGKGMVSGIFTHLLIAQALNLATRRQFTWQNHEKGHQLDAWIGGEDDGYWFSPLSVYAEITHDVIRYAESRPHVWKALTQIGLNKLGPMGRMLNVLWTSESPMGEAFSSSFGVAKGAAAQFAPIPISFGEPGKYALNKLVPSLVSPPRKGAMGRQLFASLTGTKVTVGKDAIQEMSTIARDWAKEQGYPDPMLSFQPTDQPSYSKLRAAIRNNDIRGAKDILQGLYDNRPKDETVEQRQGEIFSAMANWRSKGFTPTAEMEAKFRMDLEPWQEELYWKAMEQKLEEYFQILDFLLANPPIE